MNPIEYIENLEKILNQQKSVSGDTTLKYTQDEHIKHLLHYTKLIKNMVENGSYELHGVSYEGVETKINGIECTKTEVEDIILIQPLTVLPLPDYEGLMDAVRQVSDQGSLSSKSVLVIPYDIKFLKAKIKK